MPAAPRPAVTGEVDSAALEPAALPLDDLAHDDIRQTMAAGGIRD
jgi:hypothetical protein